LFGYVDIDYNAFFSYMSQLLGGTHINYINIITLLMSDLVVLTERMI